MYDSQGSAEDRTVMTNEMGTEIGDMGTLGT
jgi:hypothetical protein